MQFGGFLKLKFLALWRFLWRVHLRTKLLLQATPTHQQTFPSKRRPHAQKSLGAAQSQSPFSLTPPPPSHHAPLFPRRRSWRLGLAPSQATDLGKEAKPAPGTRHPAPGTWHPAPGSLVRGHRATAVPRASFLRFVGQGWGQDLVSSRREGCSSIPGPLPPLLGLQLPEIHLQNQPSPWRSRRPLFLARALLAR